MAQSLYTLDKVYFVAGRSFKLNGKQIRAGQVVEGAHALRNIESFVRTRHLIAVVDNLNDVPVYHQKDVKTADLLELKYRLKITGRPRKVEPPQPAPVPAPPRPVFEDKPRKKPGPKPRKRDNDE